MKIKCKPIDWNIIDEKTSTFIDCVGFGENDTRLICRTRYKPWFHIYRKYKDEFIKIVNEKFVYNGKRLDSKIRVGIKDEDKYDCQGYHSEKTELTRVKFECMRDFHIIKRKCISSGIEFFNNVDLVLKFVSDFGLKYSSWIEFDVECELDIGTCPSYLTSNPMLYMGEMPPVKPRIFSFDLETHSSVKNTFSNPLRKKDVIIMCGVVTDGPNGVENIVITIKDSEPSDRYQTIVKTNEIELIGEIWNLIKKYDPDCIIGYNIFKFDIKYIKSRLVGHPISNFSRYKEYECKFSLLRWESSARGLVEIHNIEAFGRIFVDLYPYIKSKKQYPEYKLNYVAGEIIGEHKEDLPAHKIFENFNIGEPSNIATIASYCVQDCALPYKMMHKLLVWYELTEASNSTFIKIFEVSTRGQGEKAFHLEFLQMMKNDFFFHKFDKQNENYEGAKVFKSTPGIYDYIITLDFASLYPSIIRRYNLCYTTLVEDDSVPDDMCYVFEWNDIIDKVDIVPRKTKFIKQEYRKGLLPLLLDDLIKKRSDTRKIMERYPEDSLEYKIYDLMQLYFKISANSVYGNKGTSTSKTPCYAVARTTTYIGRMSITKVANFLQDPKNELEIGKYVYGESYIPLGKYFSEVLYGDTDSVMLYTPSLFTSDENLRKLGTVGLKLSEYVNKLFEAPMKLEFEKVMRKFLPLSKKIYGYTLVDKKAMKANDLEQIKAINCDAILGKGNVQVKRDYTKFCKTFYKNLTRMIFQGNNFYDIIYYIEETMIQLLSYSVPKEDLILTLEVKSGKDEKHCNQVFKRRMKSLGFSLEDNERIKYIHIDPLKYYDEAIIGKRTKELKFNAFIKKDKIKSGLTKYLYDEYKRQKEIDYNVLYIWPFRYFEKEIAKQSDKILMAIYDDYVDNYMQNVKLKLMKIKIKINFEIQTLYKEQNKKYDNNLYNVNIIPSKIPKLKRKNKPRKKVSK